MTRQASRLVTTACLLLGLTAAARAQTFPPASPWQPLPCGLAPMSDAVRDQPGAVGERDIVGDADAPAGSFAADPTFLYLQLRVDDDPAPAGKLRPFVWGFELSIDKDRASYEILIALNGVSGNLEVYRNSTTTRPGDPADPADKPAVLSYPFASHARVTIATGSAFGGNADYLISLAVPWKDLEPLGLRPLTPALVWAGTSSSANALDGDLACHDGGGPSLLDIGGVWVVFDVVSDTDGDKFPDWYEVRFGTDPANPASQPAGPPPPPGSGPGSLVVEGGGGCQLGGAGSGLLLGLLLLLGLGLGLGLRTILSNWGGTPTP